MRELQTENNGSLVKEWFPFKPEKLTIIGIYLILAFIFMKLFSLYGYGPTKMVKYCVLMGGLFPIAYEDYKNKRIPNRWLLYLVGLRVVLFVVESLLYPAVVWDNLKFTLSGGVVSAIVLYVAYVLSKHEIGLGDVKLFAVIGLYLGMGVTYFVILMSLIVAAIYGGINLLRKRLHAKDEIAFGPFVFIGTIIILALGF